jgi:predicted MFS family arabinose efflux permease
VSTPRLYTLIVLTLLVAVIPNYIAPIEIAAIIGGLHVSTSLASAVLSGELFAATLAAVLIAGVVSDLVAPKLARFAGAALVASAFFSIFTWSPWLFIVLRLLAGAACGVLYAVSCFWSGRDAKGFRAFATGIAVAGAAAALSMNFLLNGVYAHGLRGLYPPLTLFTAAVLVLLVVVLGKRGETHAKSAAPETADRSGIQRRWVLVLILVTVACSAGGSQLIWSLSERVAHDRGYDSAAIGTLLTVGLACQICGSLGAAVIGGRLNILLLCGLGMLVSAGAGLAVGYSSTLTLFEFTLYLCEFAISLVLPLGVGIAGIYDSSGRVSTLVGAVCLFAGALTPMIGGIVFDTLTPAAVLWVVTAIFCVGAVTSFCLMRPLRRSNARAVEGSAAVEAAKTA